MPTRRPRSAPAPSAPVRSAPVRSADQTVRDAGQGGPAEDAIVLAGWWKRIVSAGLIFYLGVVLLGPLANPIGSDFLTRPLARAISPIHRALFLGHGYRFFGPDPGPTHLIVFRIEDKDGKITEGKFPDRDRQWPRLRYHRWFMLSETIFNELSMTPDDESFRESDSQMAMQIQSLRSSGKHQFSQQVSRERQRMDQQYQDARQRIESLIASVSRHLLTVHQGQRIEIYVQERNLPFPAQVLTGAKLDAPQFLSPEKKIGEYRINEDGTFVSVGGLPTPTGSAP